MEITKSELKQMITEAVKEVLKEKKESEVWTITFDVSEDGSEIKYIGPDGNLSESGKTYNEILNKLEQELEYYSKLDGYKTEYLLNKLDLHKLEKEMNKGNFEDNPEFPMYVKLRVITKN